MKISSLVVVCGVVVVLILGSADLAEARGVRVRGGTSVRVGIGVSRNRSVRYYGPGFYAAPSVSRVYRQGSVQYQQRPWNYARSGPYQYYRPYNPLYRVR